MTTRVTTLANGLRVASEDMPHVETASVGVWVDVGARNEAKKINGISHLLEHMAFKGTERRTAQAIAEEIEAVGGQLNAYTSREQTAYYAKVMKQDVELAVDILADILQHSVFDEDELKRERAVVIQEIAQAHDTPDDIVFDYFQETAYPDQAIGRTILGPADLVADFTRDDLANYMGGHYSAARMVMVGAGRIDHDKLVELAGEAFDSLPPEKPGEPEPAGYAGGESRKSRELEQVHFLVGFDGVSFGDPDFYILQVLSTLLGGGMSSRLFQEIRERRGLAYSVFTFASSYVDGGIFGVYAGSGPNDLPELVPVMAEEMMKVCEAVEEKEIKRARAQLKAGLLMSLESTSSRCERLGRHLLIFGRPIPIDELVAKVDAVTKMDVCRLARRLFAQSHPSVAALGPIEKLESYDTIVGRFG